jgi:hypothetical protein
LRQEIIRKEFNWDYVLKEFGKMPSTITLPIFSFLLLTSHPVEIYDGALTVKQPFPW